MRGMDLTCAQRENARKLDQMNSAQTHTKTPEEWLAAAEGQRRGRFKIFLGYAPGVGKTFSMLSEALRRKSRGEDVVVGIAVRRDGCGCDPGAQTRGGADRRTGAHQH
jgi:hypothetical protein